MYLKIHRSTHQRKTFPRRILRTEHHHVFMHLTLSLMGWTVNNDAFAAASDDDDDFNDAMTEQTLTQTIFTHIFKKKSQTDNFSHTTHTSTRECSDFFMEMLNKAWRHLQLLSCMMMIMVNILVQTNVRLLPHVKLRQRRKLDNSLTPLYIRLKEIFILAVVVSNKNK